MSRRRLCRRRRQWFEPIARVCDYVGLCSKCLYSGVKACVCTILEDMCWGRLGCAVGMVWLCPILEDTCAVQSEWLGCVGGGMDMAYWLGAATLGQATLGEGRGA